jgi:hypothetical protein
MRNVAFSLATVVAVHCMATATAASQSAADAKLPPLMDEAAEIALARSAAPAAISSNADVWVLRRGGHEKVVTGTSGVACIVQRDHPDSLYPICYDAEGARTILQVALREQRLREQGWTMDRINADVAAAIERGELNVPTPSALAWMQSARQVIYAGAEGPRIGEWKPHVMVYMPYATEKTTGVMPLADGDFMIREPGTATAHLIIISRDWAQR